MEQRIIYIAHPIGAYNGTTMEQNLENLRRIVRHINLTMPDVTPLVPYYADTVSLDDSNPAERERGIVNDMAIIRSGVLSELWLTGPRVSPGMRAERQLALDNYIPVLDKTGDLPTYSPRVIKTETKDLPASSDAPKRQINWPLTIGVWSLVVLWIIYWMFIN